MKRTLASVLLASFIFVAAGCGGSHPKLVTPAEKEKRPMINENALQSLGQAVQNQAQQAQQEAQQPQEQQPAAPQQ